MDEKIMSMLKKLVQRNESVTEVSTTAAHIKN